MSDSAGGCTCKIVLNRLIQLGATHAARMHRLGPDHPWSGDDWLLHFREEEQLILPRLRGKIPDDQIRAILADHGVMRREISRYGRIMSTRLLREHAAAEDRILMTVRF